MKSFKYFLAISLIFCLVSCNMDTEYLGHYITSVSYEEPWDEYIHRTCTRTVSDGYDSEGHEKTHEEEYDCSYVDYHSEKYYFTREDGHTTIVNEKQYHQICRKLGTKPTFVDMHRHYHHKDGDKYVTKFNGDRHHMWTLTAEHQYKNKVMKSKSIFNFSDVSKEDKEKYHLYDYPDNFDYINDQNPIIGYKPTQAVIDSFQYLNAYYGGKYQFRCYVMIWKNADIETSFMEQNYLVGGNKNEVVICISIDNSNNIQWVNAFSWEDNPYISVGVNHLFDKGEKLNLMKLNRFLLTEVPKKWKRKEFKDFEYIDD